MSTSTTRPLHQLSYDKGGAVLNARHKDYALAGNGVTLDTGGLQDWLDDCADGRRGYLPKGSYLVDAAGAQALLAADSIGELFGDGIGRSVILVKSTVAQSVDVMRILGAGGNGFRMRGISIMPEVAFIAGSGTVSAAAGTLTFSVSQAGVVSVGGKVKVGATTYTVLTFNGTTSATVTNTAAAFAASAFTVAKVPGRYGLNIDVSTNYFAYADFNHIEIGTFGDYSLKCTNTPPNIDGWFTTSIMRSKFLGGVHFDKAGDSLHFKYNTVTGPRGLLVDLVYDVSGGAMGLEIEGCNLTPDAGTRVLSAVALRFVSNICEQPNLSTAPNSALLDLDGSALQPIENAIVERNKLGATTAKCLSTVRVNYAYGTEIGRNFMVAPGVVPTYAAYRITANALATKYGSDHISPFGIKLEDVTEDLSISSQVDWISPVGTNPRFIGHKSSKLTDLLTQAGYAQTAASIIWGVIAAATTVAGSLTAGFLRVFGNGDVRIGDGADNGFPFQVKGSSSLDGDVVLEATRKIRGRDSVGTIIDLFDFSAVDNVLRIGTGAAPASNGLMIFRYRGTEIARIDNGFLRLSGDVKLNTAGNGLYIKEGANATSGAVALVGGTVTVSTTKVTANSRIHLSRASAGGALGHLSYTVIAGTSFTITSSSGTDTSSINWVIVEPA